MLRNKIVNIILSFIFIISLFRYYNAKNTDLSNENLSVTLLMVLCAFCVFGFRKEKYDILKGNYLKPSLIFFVGFVLVHFFEYLAYVIGVYEHIKGVEFVNSSIINEASICSLSSLLMLLLGYNLFNCKSKSVYHKNLMMKYFGLSKILDFLLMLSVILFYIYTDDYYFRGGYGEILNGEGLPLISEITQKVIHACQLGYCVDKAFTMGNGASLKKYVFSYSAIYYISMLFYFILVLMSGDRGPILYIGIIYVVPYYIINKKKLNLLTCIVGLIFAATTISLLGTVREMSGDLSLTKIVEAQQYRKSNLDGENLLFANTSELSNVVRAYHVLYYYADSIGVFYGLGLINQLLGIIPGLRYFLYPLLGIDDSVINSSILSTQLLNSDHGMGSTCLGDIYINLGFFGSMFFSIIFGAVLRKVDVSLYEIGHLSNTFLSLFCLSVLSFAIYIGRATYFVPLGLSFYAWIITWGSLKLKTIFFRR